MSAFRELRFFRSGDVGAIALLAAWSPVYFWQVTLGQNVWFTTDVVRLFHPFGVELARALNEGRLPLWTPGLLAGFPLLAEGQVGALYPINWLLYKLLPAHFALSYGILLHLAWAGVGMYACARSLGVRAPGACLAGFVFSFNGVIFGHLSHPSVIATMAWLPWLIFFQDRLQKSLRAMTDRRAVWFALTTLAFGVQFLCGSAQLAFLNALTFGAFGIAGGWLWHRRAHGRAALAAVVFSTVLPGILGGGIAAAQLLPTSELTGYSVRRAASQEFFASYSLPVEALSQALLPFARGEPSEASGEYWFYFGIAPLLLALLAPLLRRNRQTIFLLCLALVALALALVGQNPLYAWLYRLPIFGLFRVPARYLFIFVFAAALLGAGALDALAQTRELGKRTITLATGFALGVIALAYAQPLDFWLTVWQILPLPLGLVSVALIGLSKMRRLDGAVLASAIVGLTVLDLASFFPPFLATIDALTPAAYVETVPRSATALGAPQKPERVFTDLSVFPSLPALRGSFFPSSGLTFGRESAQAYTSLEYARHQAYFYNLAPAMLNLLNVRYWMVPLEPRPQAKMATPADSVALDILDNEVSIAPTPAAVMYIASATEQAANLADGTPVAEITLRFDDDTTKTLSLRVGVETADWDYDRKQAAHQIKHQRARIAHSFSAYWRAFGRAFEGHTYLARYDLAARKIVGVGVRVLQPTARLLIESIWFNAANGASISLAHLTGKNAFRLAYLSDTVAAWENLDLLPRAFVVHAAKVMNDDAALARLSERNFRADQVVLLGEESAEADLAQALPQPESPDTIAITRYQPERVEMAATTAQPGYVVLTDSWYPGWNAFVDGQPAPLYRADVLFRAVRIEPGTHTLVFDYRPMSFMLGAAVSASLLIVTGIVIFYLRHGNRIHHD